MQIKGKKIVAGMTAFSLVISSCLTSVMAEPVTSAALTKDRISGANRYETAVEVSKSGWTSSDYVVLASGQSYADALCAVPLAKKYSAPILLTEKDKLNDSTKNEIARLKAKHVIIIGKEGAVSENAENALKSIVSAENIERIGGSDRYETSVKVAEKLGKTKKAVLAYGGNYADALSIAPAAASEGMPILLTKSNELPKEVEDYAKSNSGNIDATYAIGGASAVSAEVSSSFAGAATASSKRIGGADRFETNAQVLQNFKEDFNYDNIYVVVGAGTNGTEFADALSASPLAAKKMAPVVLAYKGLNSKLEAEIKSEIAPKKNVVAIGGTSVVPESVIDKVKSLNVPAVVFNTDAVVKSKADVTNNNVDIEGKNVTLKDADVTGNVYIYGDGAKLSNVKVAGTVYVNPGENGSASLENVTAANIKVLSGAANSIHLKDTKADKLSVQSENVSSSVRIVAEGSTDIKSAFVSTTTIIEGAGGSFGTVTVTTNADNTKVIEFKGKFTKDIIVEGAAQIKVAAGTQVSGITLESSASLYVDPSSTVSKVTVDTLNSTDKVTLGGNISLVEVKTPSAIEVASGAKIANISVSKEAGSGITIDVPKDAVLTAVTGDGAKDAKLEGEGAASVSVGTVSEATTGGSATGGGNGSGSGNHDHEDTTIQNTYFNNLIRGAVAAAQSRDSVKNNFDISYNISDGSASNTVTVTLKNVKRVNETVHELANETLTKLQTKITSDYGDYASVKNEAARYENYANQIKVSGESINSYIADKLKSKHGNLAMLLNDIYAKDTTKEENDAYNNVKSDFLSYKDAVALLNAIAPSDGKITVPQVTVSGLTFKSAVVTDAEGNKKLSINPNDELDVKYLESELEDKASAFNGYQLQIAMTDANGRTCTYTVTFIAK